MGDPLSAAASVIALVEAAGKTAQAVYKATKTLKYAQRERKEVLKELRRLQEVLDQAFEGFDSGTGPDDAIATGAPPIVGSPTARSSGGVVQIGQHRAKAPLIEMFTNMTGPLSDCNKILGELRSICEMDKSDLDESTLSQKLRTWVAQDADKRETKRSRLWWLLHKNAIMEKVQAIRRRRDELNFQIVSNTAGMQVSISRRLASIEESLNRMQLGYIYEWLQPPDAIYNLNAAMSQYEDEDEANATGQWLLQSTQIHDWKSHPSLFWLRGIPGSGKTILTSKVIAMLADEISFDSNVAVLFHFFEFGNLENKVQPDYMLRAFLAQAASLQDRCVEDIQDIYGKLAPRQPSSKELLNTLKKMITRFDKLFIVIDALDESSSSDQLDGIFRTLISCANVHLFVSSRKEARLERSLISLAGSCKEVEGAGINTDIELYIRRRFTSNEDVEEAIDDELLEKVVDKLVSRAEGMFRWVECQLDVLDNYWLDPALDSEDIVSKVTELPSGLFSTYDRILESVDTTVDQDKFLWEKSVRILSTLAFSIRPLSVYEIHNLLGLRPENDMKWKVQRIQITPSAKTARAFVKSFQMCCGSLISTRQSSSATTDSETQVRLSHQSVRDYLLSDHLKEHNNPRLRSLWLSPQRGHRLLAELCLAALLSLQDYESFNEKVLAKHPFLTYAANEWQHHVKEAGSEDCARVDELLFEFFHESENPYLNWHRITRPGVPARGPLWDFPKPIEDRRSKEELISSHIIWGPVSYSAMWNIWLLIERLVGAGRDPNELSGGNTNPMMIAAQNASYEAIDMLVKMNGNINHFDWIARTPLHNAIEGRPDDLKLLKFMLERGAGPFCTSGVSGNSIHVAAFEGLSETIRLLLEYVPSPQGANVCFEHDREIGCRLASPLQCAAYNGHIDTMNVLLEHGADVNLASGEVGTALHAAALHGGSEATTFLIDKGANLATCAGRWGTVFTSAGYGGDRLTLEKLLRYSQTANSDEMRAKGEAWDRLSSNEARQAYLDSMISEAQNKHCPNLLQAAQIGATDMARYYIDQGANLEERDFHSGYTALNCAVRGGHLEMAKMLIERNADVNAGSRHSQTPLILAAHQGDLDIVKLLVGKGARLDAKDSVSLTALVYARMFRKDEIVEYLEREQTRLDMVEHELAGVQQTWSSHLVQRSSHSPK